MNNLIKISQPIDWQELLESSEVQIDSNRLIIKGRILEHGNYFSVANKDLALAQVRDYLRLGILSFITIDFTGRLATIWYEVGCCLTSSPKKIFLK